MEISVDTTKATNLPGAVPSACLGCERPFSRVLKPAKRLQAKARLIMGVGLAISFFVAVITFIAIAFVLSGNLPFTVVIPFPRLVLGGGGMLLAALPAYGFGVWALRLPRIVYLECKSCGWSETYLVDRTGKVIS